MAMLIYIIIVPTAILNYGGGCGVILLDRVHCNGSEDRLSLCTHDPFYTTGDCTHSTDVGVRCLTGESMHA